MRIIDKPWNRDCPDCNTTFASVQSIGVCPRCQLVFEVDCKGQLLSRRHRICNLSAPQLTQVEESAKYVHKSLRFLQASKITIEEFNLNLLLHWVALPQECWIPSALAMPNNIAQQFMYYLDELLLPLEYKPSPIYFMLGPFNTDQVEQKKRDLEPTYREIHSFWRKHTNEIVKTSIETLK
jgi:phage FluMu protein Com